MPTTGSLTGCAGSWRWTGSSRLRLTQFGFPGELRDRLVRAILEDGAKTATLSLLEEYGPRLDPMPALAERRRSSTPRAGAAR